MKTSLLLVLVTGMFLVLTVGSCLQDTPDYDAMKEQEYENAVNNTADSNDEESDN